MKKLINSTIVNLLFNSLIFIFLMISIQNSNNKHKIYFFTENTVQLPLPFIIGSSFILGSLSGNIIYSIYKFKK